MKKTPLYIKAVLFDFDGTLTKPESLDLKVIKKAIGCPPDSYLLEYIEKLPSPEEQKQAYSVLDQFELQAAAEAKPNPGAEDLVQYLSSRDIRMGIISRNSGQSIRRALKNFKKIGPGDFDLIISRDAPVRPKPSGDGILMAAERLNVPAQQVLMVGDYVIDVQAGQKAGAITVLLDNPKLPVSPEVECDFRIKRLNEVEQIVRMGLPLPAGKLPNELLDEFLIQFSFEDPAVLISPGVGEDTAAVDVENEEVLVLKSDPITFATDSIGSYAVLVNANDIATAGATPRWFLSTLLFPVDTSAFAIRQVMAELSAVCRQWGITLCGGHTEITDAVSRPVVTGMMTGTVTRQRLIDKQNIRTGDRVLLTLKRLGVPASDIANCRRFLDRIGILEEARIAGRTEGVSAMHDVTEGGLATALEELSVAGGHRIWVDMDKIPIYPETAKICGLLKIDPLGLIGSGSLLICCREYASEVLLQEIKNIGIPATIIGEVREAGPAIEAVRQHAPVPWPKFKADEITRLF
jgi:HAD superfamily hydrolase (TIGR01509 family)